MYTLPRLRNSALPETYSYPMLLPRHPSSLVQVIPLLISFEILCFLYSFTTLVCVPKLSSLLFPGFEPYMRVCVEPYMHTCVQSRPILCDPMDCNPPGSSVHGLPLARILEWFAISSSRDPPETMCHQGSPLNYLNRII